MAQQQQERVQPKVQPQQTPPQTVSAQTQEPLFDSAAFLTKKGWAKTGVNSKGESVYQDPLGSNDKGAVRKEACTLPTQGGGEEKIFQFHGAPIPWAYREAEALEVQRHRDKVAKAG